MNYPETLNFLFNTLPMYQRVGPSAFKKDLSNIRRLCDYLKNPQDSFKSIHIAGTNGKGSSSHMLAAVLQESGYKTGLYTSPHLRRFTERIRINGKEIPESDIVKFVDLIHSQILEINPSFFEITVAMAFWYFALKEVDIAVIEVGLGGRLDSTNIIVPEVSLITNISLDHTEMLGTSIQQIAGEKGGIIKNNVPVVIGESHKSYNDIFEKIARNNNAPHVFAEKQFAINRDRFLNKSSGKEVEINLKEWPSYQIKNLPGVLSVFEILKNKRFIIPEDAIKSGIENFKQITYFKGRWQVLKKNPLTICDTGHNIAGIKAVVEEFSEISFAKLHIVWGMVKDKDIRSMLELLPSNATFYFCKPNIPRGQEAATVFQVARELGLNGQIIDSVNEAVKMALSNATKNDLIYIGGSTFVVAELENL